MSHKATLSAVTALLILAVACSSSTSDVPTDAGTCGVRPSGDTCLNAGGACEDQVCVASTWQCATGTTKILLTPTSCNNNPDSGGVDSGCGEPKIGVTCKRPSGGCEDQICIQKWKCPPGDTEVPVAPV